MENPEEYSHRIYNQTLSTLEGRSKRSDFSRETVEAEYEALCVYQGHGMDGRNIYKDAEIEGQIDAYQIFIHRLGSESSEK